MFCPNCGADNPADAGFCPNCGIPLAAESGSAPIDPAWEREANPVPSRPVWPWIVLGIVALAAVAVIVILLLSGKDKSSSDPATGTPVSPAPIGELSPPTPTMDVVVITPAPVTQTPVMPVTPAPATPSVPAAIKVFFFEKELDEFTEAVGESLILNAQAYPVDDFTNASFEWSTSDPSVLKLEPDAYGRTCTVTALKHQPGGVTLTVSCSGATKELKVYTKNASTPAPTGSDVTLTSDIQYRINIFLSNFSEQSFGPFNLSTAADDQMMQFVWIYCKINNPSAIHYEGSYETVSLEDMNAQLQRFFNLTRYPYDGASYMLDAWNSFDYHDGKFWFPAASGESYNKFTVVDSMTRNADGSYDVQFQIYALGLEEYWNTPGVAYSFYELNSNSVANMVWSERVTPVQAGTARVHDYTRPNGVATYQLISYDVWDIEFSMP